MRPARARWGGRGAHARAGPRASRQAPARRALESRAAAAAAVAGLQATPRSGRGSFGRVARVQARRETRERERDRLGARHDHGKRRPAWRGGRRHGHARKHTAGEGGVTRRAEKRCGGATAGRAGTARRRARHGGRPGPLLDKRVTAAWRTPPEMPLFWGGGAQRAAHACLAQLSAGSQAFCRGSGTGADEQPRQSRRDECRGQEPARAHDTGRRAPGNK